LQSNKNRNEKPNSTLNQHEKSQQHNHNNHQSNGIIIVIGAVILDNRIHHQEKHAIGIINIIFELKSRLQCKEGDSNMQKIMH
jgi:hypothetical protein